MERAKVNQGIDLSAYEDVWVLGGKEKYSPLQSNLWEKAASWPISLRKNSLL